MRGPLADGGLSWRSSLGVSSSNSAAAASLPTTLIRSRLRGSGPTVATFGRVTPVISGSLSVDGFIRSGFGASGLGAGAQVFEHEPVLDPDPDAEPSAATPHTAG